MLKMKDTRKPKGLRKMVPEDFPDLDIRKVRRRESSRRLDGRGLDSTKTQNSLIQDHSKKIRIVGIDVEALYPSLEAVEVAQIVYKAVMETEVKFVGVDLQEACRLIALTSSEQECRLGPLNKTDSRIS